MRGAGPAVSLAPAFLLVSLVVAAAGDPAGAERQYRLARRLSAEGAVGAREALHRVLELDPEGPLADDALVDEAALLGSPAWPEELGRAGIEDARRALQVLDRALEAFPRGDRADEARLRRGLLRLEPLVIRDPARARLDLVAVASGAPSNPWGLAARYAAAHLDEEAGETGRARGGFTRLLVDHPGTEAALRAKTGLARILLREARAGAAASLLQEALDEGTPEAGAASSLRELAVRAVLREVGGGGGWRLAKPRDLGAVLPDATALVGLPGDGFLVADRKRDRVARVDSRGRAVRTWALRDVTALAADGRGRAFAAAGDGLFRLSAEGAVKVAGLGRFAEASSLAADAAGTIYIADRHGDRIGVLGPGKTTPELLLEQRGAEISALAWDGRRLVAALSRSGTLAEVSPAGALRTLTGVELRKPVALAADAAGGVAVLDVRAGQVLLLGPRGDVRDRLALSEAGVERAEALGIGADGDLILLEASTGRLVVLP